MSPKYHQKYEVQRLWQFTHRKIVPNQKTKQKNTNESKSQQKSETQEIQGHSRPDILSFSGGRRQVPETMMASFLEIETWKTQNYSQNL